MGAMNKTVLRSGHNIYLSAKASPHAPYMAHEAAESLINIYLCPDPIKTPQTFRQIAFITPY